MRIEVGTPITFLGEQWMVSKIGTCEESSIAAKDSDILRQELSTTDNTNYVDLTHIDPFLAGDIITTKYERVSLMRLGEWYYVYTKFEITKEPYNARSNAGRSEDSDEQASGIPPEGPGDGAQDGESIREEGSSAAD